MVRDQEGDYLARIFLEFVNHITFLRFKALIVSLPQAYPSRIGL